jgi:hypothetical protein
MRRSVGRRPRPGGQDTKQPPWAATAVPGPGAVPPPAVAGSAGERMRTTARGHRRPATGAARARRAARGGGSRGTRASSPRPGGSSPRP